MRIARRVITALGVGLALVSPSPVQAVTATCEDWVAVAVSVQGRLQARRAGEPHWVPVRLNDTYCRGDAIRVEAHSRAALVLRTGVVLRLDQKTYITLAAATTRETSWIDLLVGTVHVISRITRSLTLLTPFVNAAVEGTEFWIEVGPDEARLTILEGRVSASNAAGRVVLTSRQSATARAGQAPVVSPVLVSPPDAVQWALYYSPLLEYRPADFPDRPGEAWRAQIRGSLEVLAEGDLGAAFDRLAGLPERLPDARAHVYRAGLLLTVGRVDEAMPEIDRALALDSRNAAAVALRAIVAVATNARDEALSFAQQAVALDGGSATARLALSYARQAAFDLPGALASAQEAARLQPDSSLARVRLAELWLSLGNLDRALEAAREAVRLNPRQSRAHVVLGFAYLTQIRPAEAAQAFEAAIRLDAADPLPRLGLGLAKIRQGDLEAGRQELEVAVSLDPGQALLRSYLGKGYYEEKRHPLDGEQFLVAKELDGKDPTAWLYDAIRKLSLNRPIEALHDLERSIELNDNRAVYRSRLLLDADRATRSATLARVYDELGFQQRALVEGWTSVNTDPANYSAHRFLAESYAVLPRHEIARVSEVLQSQLLQPVNVNPVPPQLGLSRSSILVGTGPATAGFNEFDPLFERNRFSLRASGVAGDHATWADEVVASAVWGRFSLSVGQFHYETDGFRPNNDQSQDIYNVFAQWSLSARTSMQTEFRSSDFDRGDLILRFDPDNFLPSLRQEDDVQTVRFGLRHEVVPDSTLLASLMYSTGDFHTEVAPGTTLGTDERRYSGELQHLFRHARLNLVSGSGYFHVERDDRFLDAPLVASSIRHGNLYAYSLLSLGAFTATVGASADLFSGGITDRDSLNPKLGLAWDPMPGTTVRGAAFRTFKRTLITNQTLEPTQVAGFNQFFDDPEATEAWRYGVGVDQAFGRVFGGSPLYAGVEATRRDLTVPALDLTAAEPRVKETDETEDEARAYVYWAPHQWLAVGAEYLYERFERDPEASNEAQIAKVRTHRIPLWLAFFHPSGLMARVRTTGVSQEGTFRNAAGDLARGDDAFWVVDASVGYRLPRRWGLITLEARNLFDEHFRFQETDPVTPTIAPERTILFRFTLAY
ncbi:MAG: TonB-dependent receptor domain-containing protein [Candidatus Rokuibacteriota bacterium]